MKRTGSAVWKGGIKDGGGTVSTESGALKDLAYSFAKRFGEEAGTNPEELIGAAHASCFSMALSGALGKEGLTADEISASSTVTISPKDGGFSIPEVHLTVTARIPGTDEATFLKIAQGAKENCPVSKVLNATITMDAKLVS